MGWPFERVVLIRHGETEWNQAGRRHGQLDSPLTAIGERQAHAAASRVATMKVDGLFSSPLGRAHRTALAVSSRVGLPVRVLDDLAEVNHGSFAGMTNEEIEASHPGALARRSAEKYTWRFPGGESYFDAERRAFVALNEVARAGAALPLLVTHEMVGRMLLRVLLGLHLEEALAASLPHGAVLELLPFARKPWSTSGRLTQHPSDPERQVRGACQNRR